MWRLVTPKELAVDYYFAEGGDSYAANALGKAAHLHSLTGLPALADDSGLAVAALSGAPGIHSARYGSQLQKQPLTDRQRCLYLLKQMAGKKERQARFICALALYTAADNFYVAQKSVDGIILQEIRGAGGFGYDPVFYLPEQQKSVALLTESDKDRLMHRGLAAESLKWLTTELSSYKKKVGVS